MLDRLRSLLTVLLGIGFIAAGINHFVATDFYVAIMPPYLPWHRELVWISGVFEILGGVGVLLPAWRRVAGWGLLALLVAVFPANIHMAVNQVAPAPLDPDPVMLWLRLPMQLVFCVWVWWCTLYRPAVAEAADA